MTVADGFVPADFVVPRALAGGGSGADDVVAFRLEPLGPQHNESDHAAWMSSIDHIRATPGFGEGEWGSDTWPFPMSAEANRADLADHASEFDAREAFAFTVLAGTVLAGPMLTGKVPADDSSFAGRPPATVIGCVYIDPDPTGAAAAMVRSWVRVDLADLDAPLVAAVSAWLATDWPFSSVRWPGRAAGGSSSRSSSIS